MSTPIPEPKVGQMVRWKSPASEDGEILPRDYPAIITRVWTPYGVSLFVMKENEAFNVASVPYDESTEANTPETWFWLPTPA